MTIDELVAFFRADDRISGACNCASVRRGVADEFSDYDIWVFMAPGEQISMDYVWAELMPAELRAANLEEGRDDSWADYVVLNVLVSDRILNLKFLRMELFTDFCREKPSWDLDYMENLENYWTMDVRFDKDGLLATHKKYLEQYALREVGEVLVPELMRRYAIHYWRSVYQGVLRDEVLEWTTQIFYLAELMVTFAHLLEDRLPPCKKWILSRFSLGQIGEVGTIVAEILHLARRADITDKKQVLQVYALFAKIEDKIVNLEINGWADFWWRRVLDERMRNHHVPAELTEAIESVMGDAVRPLKAGVA